MVISAYYNGGTESITIKNTTLASLTAASFVFNINTLPATTNGTSLPDVLFGGTGVDSLNGATATTS